MLSHLHKRSTPETRKVLVAVAALCSGISQSSNLTRGSVFTAHPYIDNFDQSKNLVHGDPLTLNCSAWGHPEVTFAWYMNNRLLHADERISFGPKNMSLKIGSIEFSDRGDYTCVATNLHGSDNSTILIRVKGKES